jgi:hypothetical protein
VQTNSHGSCRRENRCAYDRPSESKRTAARGILKTRAGSIRTAIYKEKINKNKSREGEINAKMTGEVLLKKITWG